MVLARLDRYPIQTALRVRGDLARILNAREASSAETAPARTWSPAVDIYENADSIVLRADLPGVDQSNIDIEMNGETLTIRGERKFDTEDQENQSGYLRVERVSGAFSRSFTIGIPIEADKVKASYRNGVLELVVPKAEALKPKKIEVLAG